MKFGFAFFVETRMGSSKFYALNFATFHKDLDLPLHGIGKLWNGDRAAPSS